MVEELEAETLHTTHLIACGGLYVKMRHIQTVRVLCGYTWSLRVDIGEWSVQKWLGKYMWRIWWGFLARDWDAVGVHCNCSEKAAFFFPRSLPKLPFKSTRGACKISAKDLFLVKYHFKPSCDPPPTPPTPPLTCHCSQILQLWRTVKWTLDEGDRLYLTAPETQSKFGCCLKQFLRSWGKI